MIRTNTAAGPSTGDDSARSRPRLAYVGRCLAFSVLAYLIWDANLTAGVELRDLLRDTWAFGLPLEMMSVLLLLLLYTTLRGNGLRIPWIPPSEVRTALNSAAFLAVLVGMAVIPVDTSGRVFAHGGLLSSALLVPLAEEWFFRGVLWNHLNRAASGRVLGLVLTLALTSLVFAESHGVGLTNLLRGHSWTPLSWEERGYFFAWGLVFGALRWRLRSVAPPLVLHVLVNFRF